jgi:hypothetical protein
MAEKKYSGNDEIDLMELFRRMGNSIGRALTSVGKGLLKSSVFLVRNWLPLGLSILAGIGLSLILMRASPSFYTTEMVLKVNSATASEMIQYLNRLHLFFVDRNEAAIEEALSLEKGKSKEILDVQAFWIIDQNNDKIPDFVDYKNTHSVYDTINVRMSDRLNISIKVTTTGNLLDIKQGIMAFINNDSLLLQKNRLRLKQNAEMISRIKSDIYLLDSLQKIKYFEETKARQPQSGGQMIFLQEQKTQLLYEDIQAQLRRQQDFESERALYSDIVTILSDLSLPVRRENGTFYYGKKIVPAVFLLTLAVLILIANRRRLIDLFGKY